VLKKKRWGGGIRMEWNGRVEKALELESRDLDCRFTSYDFGHITNLISEPQFPYLEIL
jgi:hypothetical protein